jgi:hypothetical protein
VRTRLPAAATFLLAVVAACGDGPPTRPDLGDEGPGPLSINAVSGENQAGVVATTLPEPFVVVVVDREGLPVEGVPLEWRVAEGSGLFYGFGVDGETAVPTQTGEDGRSQVYFRPLAAGDHTAVAARDALLGSPVRFELTARPPDPD